MKKIILLFLFSTVAWAQPFAIGTTTVDFVDASRNNRIINTRIYYPADTSGTDVAITTTTADLFPVISFGHGFVMTWSSYQNIWENLVPQGYIIAFPTTEGGFSPSHLEFAKDLAFVIAAVKNLGTNSQSIFYNRVGARAAVMGHSMGGGCAHLASSLSNQINAVLTLAAAETNPSAVAAVANTTVPSLVIAGSNDCVAPPANHQTLIYNAIPSTPCKSYITITGGSHCQMANTNFNCSFGESTCTPPAAITRAVQHQILNQFCTLWLDGYLKENCTSSNNFLQTMTQSTAITYQNSCQPCTLETSNTTLKELHVFPNPANDRLNLPVDCKNGKLLVYDLQGKSHEVIFISDNVLSIEHLKKGIYFIKIETFDQQNYSFKVIKD